MNYLQLINKCLLELNYRTVNSLAELVKNDHKRIIQIINIINKEICAIEGWDFLLRRVTFSLNSGETEILNPVNGRIHSLIIDGEKYSYCTDVERYLTDNNRSNTYSSIADKLLLPKFSENKIVNVIYYTKNCVIDSENNEKEDFENSTDESLIPMPFVEQLLVYGTCLRLKSNPQYVKFPYWIGMYKEALQNLKSKSCIDFKHSPSVKIHRR